MEYSEENLKLVKESIEKCADWLKNQPDVPDGGTCNMDSVAIDFTGWPIAKVRQIPLLSDKLTSRWWKGYRFVNFNIPGMANNRNHKVELANKFLKDLGVGSVIYYQMD